MADALAPISGWGRYPVVRGRPVCSENLVETTAGAVLSRGLGRSYGDASLPPSGEHRVAVTSRADRLLEFDPASGIVRAEAGISLRQINRLFLRRGWFPPSSPGTQQVTLGGMVAADVHGKSHHAEGCFGEHVTRLRMRVADGQILEVSEQSESDLFRATLGGVGLTGHILEVEFRMRPAASAWIWCESERHSNIDSMIEALRAASGEWPFTVGWVDMLARGRSRGRGILQKGRWAEPSEAPADGPVAKRMISVPLTFPNWFLSSWSMRPFNALRFGAHGAGVKRGIMHPEAFFYPLDVIGDWNRIYGHRGFTQYHGVLPLGSGNNSYHRVFDVLERRGATPFLGILKDFRSEGRGLLSFPKPGLSLAIDMPMQGGHTQTVVDSLNDLIASEGGRVYLAKDALTRAEHYRAMEPRFEHWLEVRRKWDPNGALRSALGVRLFGDAR